MLRLKQVSVAAAMVLISASAMASNFRAADQVYIPVAGHTATSANPTFISDIWLANVSTTDAVTVSVIYIPSGAQGATVCVPQGPTQCYFDNVITLQPSERKEIVDFFPSVLGLPTAFGSLIFNGCKQGADCINTQDSNGVSPNFRNIVVESRIYSIPAGQSNPAGQPSQGQDVPGIPWYNFVSSRQSSTGLSEVFITGIRNTGSSGQIGTFRGNIGLMNASQYSTTTIRVRLFNGATRQPIGSDFTQTLGPLGFLQQNIGAMFPAFTGVTSSNAYITITQENNIPTNDAPTGCITDGCPGFLAYGSVLDNTTQDATTLESVYEQALSDAAQLAIYGAASGPTSLRRAVRRSH
jgi:hypothetical protein